jgi:CRISPR-associated endonuclease/helicase Cas3
MATFVPNAEHTELFATRFEALTGNAPFPWQESLFSLFVSETFPANVSLPTGTGKTSIIALWLLALAEKLSVDARQAIIPRRLIWVVNRRVVVDQATNEAEQLRRRLNDTTITELEPVRCAFRKISATNPNELLGISTLRGQFEDNAEWRSDPSRPAVIVGTVDMIGSRLLFSGYGIGFRAKPLHAGFLGQDALLIHDEAHLEPAFQELLTAIREEQERCNEFAEFRIMALSATSRGGCGAFGLTEEEKHPPNVLPNPPEKPIHVIWRRQEAKKGVHLRENTDEKKLADEIAALAMNKFKDSGCAVLVFVRKVGDVETVVKKLKSENQQVQQLTGTLRGWERDQVVTQDSVFRRFLPNVAQGGNTVYLVCTSAGEVGVNISADHLVCDLSTFDSMVQRFGRVNRFGDCSDTEIHILFPAQFEEKNELDDRRKKTLELIKGLHGNASPKALGELDPKDCLAAFTPVPTILPTSDILFDSWALTTIRGKLPGRPPVEPYLHGISKELPETHVAWRDEVGLITGELLEQYKPEDLLEDYPLKPHELLRDTTQRVFKHLQVIAERCPQECAWVAASDGNVQVLALSDLVSLDKREKPAYNLADCTVLLPPSVGGLDGGLLNGGADFDDTRRDLYDIADRWKDQDNKDRRCRVWDNANSPQGMRLIRKLDTRPDIEEDFDEDEQSPRHRYWSWYVRPKSADDDGSRTARKQQELMPHLQRANHFAVSVIARLKIEPDEARAVTLAAKWHDCGKGRSIWQRSIGNRDTNLVLAKSGGNALSIEITSYRHEFGSLINVSEDSEFFQLTPDVQDLVLHLIAAHHGRARPHFTIDEAFDPDHTEEVFAQIAREVPRRFARLQRKYGRWGLAYLESLLRAADALASQDNDLESNLADFPTAQQVLR